MKILNNHFLIKDIFLKIINVIFDLVFPPICGICGKLDKNYLCDECINIVKNEKIFKRIIKYNYKCNNYYNEQAYLFKYSGLLKEKMIDYKFNDKSYLFKTFSKIILFDKSIVSYIKIYDIVISVPISKNRKKERGYNQTDLIIKDVISQLNDSNKKIEYISDLLIKIRNNKQQSKLNKEQRLENVKGVYVINKKYNLYDFKNKKILIFDDIFTTGSTIKECAKTIKDKYDCSVGIFTFFKD